jgi:hypothetical protein
VNFNNKNIYLISHVSAETLTTERMMPLGTNSPQQAWISPKKGLAVPKNFNISWLSNLFIMRVFDEDYSRNVLYCGLILLQNLYNSVPKH